MNRNMNARNYIAKRNNIFQKINTTIKEKKLPTMFSITKIISIFVSIVVLLFIIILVIRIFNYNTKSCCQKKSLFEYLFHFSSNDPCKVSIEQEEQNNLYGRNGMNQINNSNFTSNVDLKSSIDLNNQLKNSLLNNDVREEDMIVRPYSGKLVDRLREVDENEVSLLKDSTTDTSNKKEVFHISNQRYTYDQSKCKCAAYGATLATKADIINAYNNGANWCTYGWSEGQNAFYPVQKCEWNKMMAENRRFGEHNRNKKKYCGYPGLNGGYFANKDLLLGVNCYGIKPKNIMTRPKEATCSFEDTCKLNINYDASNVLNTDEII